MSSTNLALVQPLGTSVLCGHQYQIEIKFDDQGNAEIIQTNWPDGNQVIRISRENISSFLDRLCDALGNLISGTLSMTMTSKFPVGRYVCEILGRPPVVSSVSGRRTYPHRAPSGKGVARIPSRAQCLPAGSGLDHRRQRIGGGGMNIIPLRPLKPDPRNSSVYASESYETKYVDGIETEALAGSSLCTRPMTVIAP